VQVNRVPFLPEVWMVPITLADLECRHGELGGCDQCDLGVDDRELADDQALEQVAQAAS
jgi:hypothetical protein